MAVLSGLSVVGLFLLLSAYLGIHQVPEGHIGMYWRGGGLRDETSDPGFHTMIPYITVFHPIQITLQTDTVSNIPCGTSGGSVIYFDKIEAVNYLQASKALTTIKKYGINYDRTWIFDRIHHEINQFCSSHTLQEVYIEMFSQLDEALAKSLQSTCDAYDTGIKIVAIRVTKPRIPENVRMNFEAVEISRTQLLVASQKEKVAKAEENTALVRAKMQARRAAEVAIIEAQQASNVSLINAEKEIKQKQAERRRTEIDSEIQLLIKKTESDAHFYKITQTAQANKKLYSESYLRALLYKSLANNRKVFFGENLPSIYSDLFPKNSTLPFP
eukprot:TRINITY_DN647_c0_g2_i11.p1 TRINITY_DN647_c0_g2~~TRINITY_DN647_c0_g2_i11.p1  ORF type:complete len:329 (-),score=53.04 TRINITY_DN647_c0_g2_i11:122-1108(-)